MTLVIIHKMIRKYGQTVEHKKKVSIQSEGEEEVTYEVQTPKRGQFDQLTGFSLMYDRAGYREEGDYIGTFLSGTDVWEGDLLKVDDIWLEVVSRMVRKTGGSEDYIEVLLRRKKV